MRDQRGKQKSDVGFNDAAKEFGRSSVAGRGGGLCPSEMASMMVSCASASTMTPEVAGGGAEMCRTSFGRAPSKTLSSACSSPGASGRGAPLRPPGSVLRRVSPSTASTVTQSGACSSPGASGCGAELGLSASALKGRELSFSELFDRCMSPSQTCRACV